MTSTLDFRETSRIAAPTVYLTRGELEELEALDESLDELEWEGKTSPNSREYIRWVQQSLNRIMKSRLATDGILGRKTRSVLRRFQSLKGLPPTGDIGSPIEKALIAAGAPPPSATGIAQRPSVTPMGVPTLVRPKETTPPAYTLYANIPLQNPLGGARSMTGIFIPENYCPQPSVDFIIYLHGYKRRSHKPSFSVDSYWRLPRFLLREAVNKSQKNVILVAPTLGPKNEPGNLVQSGGFDRFLDQVLAVLRQHGPFAGSSRTPAIGNLILACHSGSGWVMRKIAKGSSRYATQIRECWAFDPYGMGDANGWASWARSQPMSNLYIYYRSGSPGQQLSKSLVGRSTSNIRTLHTSVEHDDMPAHYLKDRIQGAQFLADKWNCRAKPSYYAEPEWTDNEYTPLKQWNLGLAVAVGSGIRDENKLTNMLFFARHPERGGRKLDGSEPNFRQLSREWLDIRNNIVRPFLARHTPGISPSATPAGTVASNAPYPEVNTPLPATGSGFLRRKGRRQSLRSYGLPETIRALEEVAAAWHAADPRRPRIQIHDISPLGGSRGRFEPHGSHRVGLDVDLVLEDGSLNMDNRNYSRSLATELARLFVSRSWGGLRVRHIFFDDLALRTLFKPTVTLAAKDGSSPHRDHFHVRFCAPSYFVHKVDKKYKNCT